MKYLDPWQGGLGAPREHGLWGWGLLLLPCGCTLHVALSLRYIEKPVTHPGCFHLYHICQLERALLLPGTQGGYCWRTQRASLACLTSIPLWKSGELGSETWTHLAQIMCQSKYMSVTLCFVLLLFIMGNFNIQMRRVGCKESPFA